MADGGDGLKWLGAGAGPGRPAAPPCGLACKRQRVLCFTVRFEGGCDSVGALEWCELTAQRPLLCLTKSLDCSCQGCQGSL
jgi:hypothetical protein